MVEIFKSIFESESTVSMVSELRSLFRGDERIRKDFILCLQQYRINSLFEFSWARKERIIACINVFLEIVPIA